MRTLIPLAALLGLLALSTVSADAGGVRSGLRSPSTLRPFVPPPLRQAHGSGLRTRGPGLGASGGPAAPPADPIARLREAARRETLLASLRSAARSLRESGDPGAASVSRLERQLALAPVEELPEPADALRRLLPAATAARELDALESISYEVVPLTAELMARWEAGAYSGIEDRTPDEGFSEEVESLDPGAPHSMEDVTGYVRHRLGQHLLDAAATHSWSVELHYGPAGLAVRSLRHRGFGRMHLLRSPGRGADLGDGFLAAVHLPTGSPVLAHVGSLGRERFLQAQALLRMGGVPSARVTRFLHGFRQSDALEGLDLPASSAMDVAAIGFSRGPVRSLMRHAGDSYGGRSSQAPPSAESALGASFVESWPFRFQDAEGRWHRLLAVGALWGDLARAAARRLVELGYRRLVFLGIGGGLRPDDRIGDIHSPAVVADRHGRTLTAAGSSRRWLSLPLGESALLPDARLVSTWSPLTETLAQLRGWRQAGWTTVDMECAQVLAGIEDAATSDIVFDALVVVSDVPGGERGQTIESRYYNRRAIGAAVDRCVDWTVRSMGATALEPDLGPLVPRRRRLGLFTGTFDPPHAGHIAMMRCAREQLGLDSVIVIPNGSPRDKPDATPYRGRCEMLWAAIQGIRGLDMLAGPEARRVYDLEGPAGVLRLAQEKYGRHHEYYQLMGADSFLKLAEKPEVLRAVLEERPVAVVMRAGTPTEVIEGAARGRGRHPVVVLPSPDDLGLSSTRVRDTVRTGEPADRWLLGETAAVMRYWRLYGGPGGVVPSDRPE